VGFRLTDEGRRVYDASLRLFAGLENFKAEVGELAGQLVGELRIGAVDNLISHPEARISQAIARSSDRKRGDEYCCGLWGERTRTRKCSMIVFKSVLALYHHLAGLTL